MNLQDLTAKELGIISWMCNEQIESLKSQISKGAQWLERGDILERVIAQDAQRLTVIREFHVQVLNAKSRVQTTENIHSN